MTRNDPAARADRLGLILEDLIAYVLADKDPSAHEALARLALRHARRGDRARARAMLEPLRARGLLGGLGPILDAGEAPGAADDGAADDGAADDGAADDGAADNDDGDAPAAPPPGLLAILAPGGFAPDPARGEAAWHRIQMALAPLSLAGILYAPERLDPVDAEEARRLAEDNLAADPLSWGPWAALAALDLYDEDEPPALIAARVAQRLSCGLIRPPALPRLILARALLDSGRPEEAAEQARACFQVAARTVSGGATLAVSGDAALLAARSLTEAGSPAEALAALDLRFPARDSGRGLEGARALAALGRSEEARARAVKALARLEHSRVDAPASERRGLERIARG